MKRFGLIIVASCVLGEAHAEVIKQDAIACVSEDLLNEATRYAIKNDMDGLMQLAIAGKCTVIPKGTQVSVIDPGFLKATIRFRGTKLFTVSEAVR